MTIDHGRRLVISRFTGEMTNDDLRRQKDLIDSGGPYPGLYYVIADFTQITRLHVTPDMLRWLAAQPSPIANARRVIVAPAGEADALAQLYQKESAATRPDTTILRNMDEAFKFLGIDMRKKPR
jgi:hypothetical protein